MKDRRAKSQLTMPLSNSSAAPVTVKGVTCFFIQLCVKFTLFGVTATAFLVWCVPSVSLLVAVDVALGSSKRTRSNARSEIVPDTQGNVEELVHPQPLYSLQLFGTSAAAA